MTRAWLTGFSRCVDGVRSHGVAAEMRIMSGRAGTGVVRPHHAERRLHAHRAGQIATAMRVELLRPTLGRPATARRLACFPWHEQQVGFARDRQIRQRVAS